MLYYCVFSSICSALYHPDQSAKAYTKRASFSWMKQPVIGSQDERPTYDASSNLFSLLKYLSSPATCMSWVLRSLKVCLFCSACALRCVRRTRERVYWVNVNYECNDKRRHCLSSVMLATVEPSRASPLRRAMSRSSRLWGPKGRVTCC